MPSYRSVATISGPGAALTCGKPSGVISGDVLVAFQSGDSGTLADMGTPTGGATWQLLTSRAGDNGSFAGTKVWWKVADGSEPSTYGFTQNSAADGVIAAVAVSGSSLLTPVATQSGSASSATTIPTPSGTPTYADDVELRWAAGFILSTAVTWTPPAGYTERADLQSRTYTTGSLATLALSSSSATGVQNFAVTSALSVHMGFTVTVAEAPSVPRLPVMPTAAVHRAASW